MAYEPTVHPAQMKILRHLLFTPAEKYSVLQKATELSSDHCAFHVKKLVEAGYVQKRDDLYTLSREGKEFANRMDTDEFVIERQPKVSVLLVVSDGKGKFLAQQRLKQPYYGFWGRQSGKLRWGETLADAAQRELQEETGLSADFEFKCLYHKLDYDMHGALLEDKLFCVMYGTNVQGELIADMEGHHNEWLSNEELVKKEKFFQNIPYVTELAVGPEIAFFEKDHHYTEDEY